MPKSSLSLTSKPCLISLHSAPNMTSLLNRWRWCSPTRTWGGKGFQLNPSMKYEGNIYSMISAPKSLSVDAVGGKNGEASASSVDAAVTAAKEPSHSNRSLLHFAKWCRIT